MTGETSFSFLLYIANPFSFSNPLLVNWKRFSSPSKEKKFSITEASSVYTWRSPESFGWNDKIQMLDWITPKAMQTLHFRIINKVCISLRLAILVRWKERKKPNFKPNCNLKEWHLESRIIVTTQHSLLPSFFQLLFRLRN